MSGAAAEWTSSDDSGVRVAVGGGAAMMETVVLRDPLCAGSAQPPASPQWALHIRRPQSLRIRVELHPIVRQVAFCEIANGNGKGLWVPTAPRTGIKGKLEGADPLGCATTDSGSTVT